MATTVRVRRRVRAPVARVFDAWLDARVAARWLFATAWRPLAAACIDARVGGAFRLVDRRRTGIDEYRGVYTSIEPHRKLAFSLDAADVASNVVVSLAATRGGCDVVVVHHGVPRAHAAQTRGRWVGMLYGLAALLEPLPEPIPALRSLR